MNAVTYDNRLFVKLGNGLVQSVKERCGHLTHSFHVGEHPVYINNLAGHERRNVSWLSWRQVVTISIYLQIPQRLHHLSDAQLQVCEVVFFSLHQLLDDL